MLTSFFNTWRRYSFSCFWIWSSCDKLLIISSFAFTCIFRWAIVSSWASKIALHSSIDSLDIGGSSKQKNSRTIGLALNSELLSIVLMNVCRPEMRLSMKPELKLFPNHFFLGKTRFTLGNDNFSFACSLVKSVKRRSTSQKLFLS